MYQYLRFFNNEGNYTNFEYDSTNDKWIGRIDMHTISTGLVENFDLYLLEEVWDSNNNLRTWTFPHGSTGITGMTASFDPRNPVEEIFLYEFTNGPTSSEIELNKIYSMEYDLVSSIDTIGGTSFIYPGMKITTNIVSEAMPIRIGFLPQQEKGYTSILTIKDTTGHIVAEITVYGEGEEEDERLRVMLQNLGHDLLPEDTIIFDTTDVNEQAIDWTIINRKRKELLLEYSNIFPYLGSYKALINIIKFYGYQNVRMKEYWKNVDINSPNYLKYRQTDISDVFTENASFNNLSLIPSKVYRKTNKFGLFYDINVESGDFDEQGIPITEEVFSFTPEEVLIKIYALKKKLQNYYLPINAKIVDIIGEAIYFAQYKIQSITEQNRIDAVSLGLVPKISVSPGQTGQIQDLRPLYNLGFPVGPDLNSSGYTNLSSYRIWIDSNVSVNTGQFYETNYNFYIVGPSGATSIGSLFYTWKRNPDNGQIIYTQAEICQTIADIINDPTGKYVTSSLTGASSIISDNYFAYPESNGQYVRIVEKNPLTSIYGGTGGYIDVLTNPTFIAPYSPPTIYFSGGTYNSINVSPGGSFGPSGAPISYYSDAFLGYFDKINLPVSKLNDDEDIPVGYPIVLHNDTFDITWEQANVTFNQVDQASGNTGPNAGLMYSQFTNSYTITGWTSIPNYGASGATYVSIPVTSPVSGFPGTFPTQDFYAWYNLGFYGYYEMQWIITGPSGFSYDSGQGSIESLNDLSLILPYVGSYKVELYLWDLYNTRAMLIEDSYIHVTIPNSDFIGWYQKRELNYEWETRKYDAQSDFVKPTPPIGEPLRPHLTWDEYASTWDLPLHPNEEIGMAEISTNSLDSIEFYQSIVNPSDNPLIDRYPYHFNLIGSNATWDDAYHLWWNNTGTRVTEWTVDIVPGPTAYIFMNTQNSNINLDGSLNMWYFIGPTGWTGSTSTASPFPMGTTAGEAAYIESNKRVYVWDGTNWNYTLDELDAYQISVGTGSTESKIKNLVSELNNLIINQPGDHPVIDDFIYYYNEKYDTNYQLQPYLKAVSIDFEKGGRHRIYIKNGAGSTGIYDTKSFETVYFGYLGDIPTHFEIFDLPYPAPTTPTIEISYLSGGTSMTTPYSIGATNLQDLVNELNGATAQAYPGIGDFTYNIVLGASGWTGPSGPTSLSSVKIQGIAKAFKDPQEIIVQFTGMKGTSYGRSLIKNPTWDDLRILKYSEELPLLTVVNFTYDNSKMWGKKNPKWTLTKEDDPNFENIYYNNKYFSYMFTERGSYSISLDLEDTNGNTKRVTKNELIKII